MSSECNLCSKNKTKTIKKFKHWRIIKSKFPYDKIAKINHILIPQKHKIYKNLNQKEKQEMDLIKQKYIEKRYDLITEATNKRKSIPNHFHIHLLVLKEK